jgi:hypothetical protein
MINSNDGDIPWAAHLASDLRKELALSDQRLFESFAKHVFPDRCVVCLHRCNMPPGNTHPALI